MAKLIVHRPDGATQAVLLDRDRTTIGRRADNDLCLAYPPVSAEHALIITIGEDSFLEDLGSTNGTLVNGERIAKHFLRDGDEIDIGRLKIVYRAHDGEAAVPAEGDAPPEEATPREGAAPVESGASEMAASEARAPDAPAEEADDPLCVSDADEAADEEAAPADELLADLMESHSTASAALDLTPTLTVVQGRPANGSPANGNSGRRSPAAAPEACVTLLSGPHAGEATPMNKAQFVFGRPGVSVAAIRRSGGMYRIVPLAGESPPVVNGGAVERSGANLAFGDVIEVAGVKLRFERRV